MLPNLRRKRRGWTKIRRFTYRRGPAGRHRSRIASLRTEFRAASFLAALYKVFVPRQAGGVVLDGHVRDERFVHLQELQYIPQHI